MNIAPTLEPRPLRRPVTNSLVELTEVARQELEHDVESAKASLCRASQILYAEIERQSTVRASPKGGLAGWQILRVRHYIDRNLHRPIHVRDLSKVVRRSPAHFSRQFKRAVGVSPHAYVVRRRLERARHLMITTTSSLSEIALNVGLSDQAHLCSLFRQAFDQSPATWRRMRDLETSHFERTQKPSDQTLNQRSSESTCIFANNFC